MEIKGYKIHREIGKGGMATVYLATQESLRRNVVLKILDEVRTEGSELGERFLAEGRILASLKHPNIITIYDIGIANDLLYISMEYLQGGDLKQRLELPITVDETLEYIARIASALGEAHRHGIVHRDVKPANILFSDTGTPILTDFGIAKEVDTATDLTSTGIFLGSPNYVSPEQAEGHKIDGRADIYSLGCIFYEMLTGEKPYISRSVIDIVIQHKQGPIPQLPEDLSEFQPLLNRMMAKNRDDRFADAGELVSAVESLRADRARATSVVEPVEPKISDAERIALRKKRESRILMGLILMGMVMFSSMKYIEVRIKSDSQGNRQSSTESVLDSDPFGVPGIDVSTQTGNGSPENTARDEKTAARTEPVSQDVLNALAWLGKQSLEEYKLTYPPKDNAYYYFTRMLEMDPGNRQAIAGILEIADRYAQQAELALAKNQHEKMMTYVEYGLRINPKNESLLALKSLAGSQQMSMIDILKGFFSN